MRNLFHYGTGQGQIFPREMKYFIGVKMRELSTKRIILLKESSYRKLTSKTHKRTNGA